MNLKFLRSAAVAATFLLALCTGYSQNPAPGAAASSNNASKSPAAAKSMPTDAAVADAKSKGLVWVNLNTKVYHKDDAVYGKTKNGQFMTEADAQKSGARLAKTSPVGKKKAQ